MVESGGVAGAESGGGLGVLVGAGVGSWLGVGAGSGLGVGSGVGEGLGAGDRVSTVSETELLASAPSLLRLPAASENLEEATEITPSAVLSAVGVKVAE